MMHPRTHIVKLLERRAVVGRPVRDTQFLDMQPATPVTYGSPSGEGDPNVGLWRSWERV
jgi:hypothetical protein